MHPDIARFPNDFFYRREQLLPVPCPHQLEEQLDYQLPSEDALDDLLKERRVLFIPSQWEKNSRPWEKSPRLWEKNPKPWENTGDAILSDKVNEAEARIVADLLRRICRQYGTRFDANKTVGVIVPYRNQIAMIRREIAQLDLPQLDGISIDTVERYQGSQRDVIIYSFTVRRPYQLDFLTANSFEEVDETPKTDGGSRPSSHTIDRKLNVAMTRARKQLIMTGNAPLLRKNAIFSALIARYSI
jgi:superfamily I DNA and/or RNA helicase